MENRVEEAVEKVSKLVEVFGGKRKEKIENILSEKNLGEFYFSSPASSQERFHYSFPGGLALHSINVFKNLCVLNEAFSLGFSEETMLVVSLFHDIGKCVSSNLKEAHYLPQDEQWRIDKRGENYKFNSNGTYFPNHLRSLYILHHYNFPLSSAEYQAIYLNDGMYIQENRGYGLKEEPLALYLHMADRIALENEKSS